MVLSAGLLTGPRVSMADGRGVALSAGLSAGPRVSMAHGSDIDMQLCKEFWFIS